MYADKDVFVKNSSYQNMARLKKKIIDLQLIPYRCDVCGNEGEWMGKQLTLQLHHLNGDNSDQRVENLVFLCPNCHAQTENYGSKTRKPLG